MRRDRAASSVAKCLQIPWKAPRAVTPFAAIVVLLVLATDGFARPQETGAASQPAGESAAPTSAPAVVEKSPDPTIEEAVYEVSGSLSTRFRWRSGGDDDDVDLYSYLSLDGGNPEVDTVTFHFYGRANWDIDGDDGTGKFFSLSDTAGDDVDLTLYEAFVDFNRVIDADVFRRIRLGRQSVYAGYSYILDGARIDFNPAEDLAEMQVSIYGGVPEYLYDTSRSGDWMAGTDLKFHPLDDTWIALRYVHVADDNDYYGAVEQHDADDFTSLMVRQNFGKRWQASAEWNTVDGDHRDVIARLGYTDAESDFTVRASYAYQNTVAREFTALYDAYVGLLLTSHAHNSASLEIAKVFEDHFGIDAGISGRWLSDQDDEGPFNREYVRAFVTFSTFRWPVDEIDLALTGEIWEAEGDDVLTAGGEVRWRASEDVRVTLGSYYSRYKYDLFVVEEREDATTIFLGARWSISREYRLDARYEFETGDQGDFHIFTVGFTWRF